MSTTTSRDGFHPPRRRRCPTYINDLVEAYPAGASISQLVVEFGVHRTTVAAHLDRRCVPRHRERAACGDGAREEAAELYAAGPSFADVGGQFGIDAQTVANRFRRAGVPCDLDGAGSQRPTPNKTGAEHHRARDPGRSRVDVVLDRDAIVLA